MPDSILKTNEFRMCNVKIHALQVSSTLHIIFDWLNNERRFHYLSSTNLNNIAIAKESEKYFTVIENADLSIPDGMPLIWYGRYLGYKLSKRCGIEEIMVALFELSNSGYDYSHYFYGNTPEVLNKLKTNLLNNYPKLNIKGMYSPPFKKLSPEEDKEQIEMINSANPDFLWVSLGCPKQEAWLYDHRNSLNCVLGGGAGAVFNFLSGETMKAPAVIQYMGLEWLFRLIQNPKKLYKRYLIKYPKIFILILLDILLSGKKRVF